MEQAWDTGIVANRQGSKSQLYVTRCLVNTREKRMNHLYETCYKSNIINCISIIFQEKDYRDHWNWKKEMIPLFAELPFYKNLQSIRREVWNKHAIVANRNWSKS